MALPTLEYSHFETSQVFVEELEGYSFEFSHGMTYQAGDIIVCHALVTGTYGATKGTRLSHVNRFDETYALNDTMMFRIWSWAGGGEYHFYMGDASDASDVPSEFQFSVIPTTGNKADMATPTEWHVQVAQFRPTDPYFSVFRYWNSHEHNYGQQRSGQLGLGLPGLVYQPHPFNSSLMGGWSPGIGREEFVADQQLNDYEDTTQTGDLLIIGTGLALYVTHSPHEPTSDFNEVVASAGGDHTSMAINMETADVDQAPAVPNLPPNINTPQKWANGGGHASWTLRLSETEDVEEQPSPVGLRVHKVGGCQLNIPHKDWMNAPNEKLKWQYYRENMLEMERWADYILSSSSRCIGCGHDEVKEGPMIGGGG
jgi:hypothetical protein